MGKKRILIVDDEESMRNAIKRLLTVEGKYNIAEACDGVAAEKEIKDFAPDLIILDIKMPGKDGYEVCLNLRKKSSMRHIKIMAVSGHAGGVGGTVINALGADCFLEKPFDNKQFMEKVQELLERT